MTDDRTPFREARDAGLALQQVRRQTAHVLRNRWIAQPEDTVGGWCVTLAIPLTPAQGNPPIADFCTQEIAEHVARLHNANLGRFGIKPEETPWTHPEIPEEAVAAVAAVLNDWFDVPVSAPAVSREALAAALPHLRVQETRPKCPDCEHTHTPEGCVGEPSPSDVWAGVTPSICDCPTPAPRPVVDREALAIWLYERDFPGCSPWTADHSESLRDRYRQSADALILALLPTEEDTKGEGHGQEGA